MIEEKMDQPIGPASLATRFFWFCSGANPDILRQCPRSEHIKFAGIGATVFSTGVLAALSGGYAFYTVFNQISLAVLFGVFWGLIIFNLDRFIVSTIKKDGSRGQQLFTAIPRFLLAVLLAIVIAKPLELRIFSSEIEEILYQRQEESISLIENKFATKIAEEEQKIVTLKQATERRLAMREKDYQDYRCECDGTCGTGARGRGSECERKEKKYLQSQTEYLETRDKNEVVIATIRDEILGLKNSATTEKATTQQYFSRGLLARLSASSDLPSGPSLFIMCLIFLLEAAPLLAKIMAPKGPYDDLLKRQEQAFYLQQMARLKKEKLALSSKVDLISNLQEAKVQQEVTQKKQAMQAITDAHLELIQDQIDDWLAREKAKRKKGNKHEEDAS